MMMSLRFVGLFIIVQMTLWTVDAQGRNRPPGRPPGIPRPIPRPPIRRPRPPPPISPPPPPPPLPPRGPRFPRPDNSSDEARTKRYLVRFGHINKEPGECVSNEDFERGLRSLQSFAGLPVTGQLDDATRRLMRMSRCGRPDIENPNDDDGLFFNVEDINVRKKRYTTGRKWPITTLKYSLYNYPAKALSRAAVARIIRRAFKYWTDESCLQIFWASYPHIKIGFFRGYHGDPAPFDGPGKVAAHAFLPTSGHVHFDNDETWTNGTRTGINLLQVAVHEFGHALGLRHSRVRSAVMYPYYRGYDSDFQLDQDDINGIRFLYGRCPAITETTVTSDQQDSTTQPIQTQNETEGTTVTNGIVSTPLACVPKP